MYTSQYKITKPLQVYVNGEESVVLPVDNIIQMVSYSDGTTQSHAYFIEVDGAYKNVDPADWVKLEDYAEIMVHSTNRPQLTEYSPAIAYNMVPPYPSLAKLRFLLDGVIRPELLDMLTSPCRVAFDCRGKLTQIGNGKTVLVGIEYPLDAYMLQMLGFYISPSMAMSIILPKLQAVREEFVPEHVDYTLTDAIKGMYIGETPVTIEMLENGFGAKLDISTNTLYDIVIDGVLVRNGLLDAIIVYDDWRTCVVVDDELSTIETSSKTTEPYQSGDSWTTVLDAFNDADSDTLKMRHPDVYTRIHTMVMQNTPYTHLVSSIDYELTVNAGNNVMGITHTTTAKRTLSWYMEMHKGE